MKAFFIKTKWINFMLSCVIVLLHSNCLDMVSSEQVIARNVIKICSTLADMAVPSFFAISAMLFFRNFNLETYTQKVKKRIKSLLVPYLIWSTLFYAVYVLISMTSAGKNILVNDAPTASIKDAIESILFAQYNGPLWYIRVLFLYVVVSPVFLVVFRAGSALTLGIGGIALLYNLFCGAAYSSPVFWLPIYMLGGYLGYRYFDRIVSWKSSTLSIILSSAVFIAFFMMSFFVGGKWYYLYRCISPVFCWVVLGSIVEKFRIDYQWGGYSFFIYCTHSLVLRIVKTVLKYLIGTSSELCIIGIYFLTALLSVGIICGFAYILEKYNKKLYNLVTGGRE